MAVKDIKKLVSLTSQILSSSIQNIWMNYDKEADVLYMNFKKPSFSDDSELADDDIIIRYEKNEIIGITILNASKRS